MNNTIKLDAGIFSSMTEYNGLYYINRSRINNNYLLKILKWSID